MTTPTNQEPSRIPVNILNPKTGAQALASSRLQPRDTNADAQISDVRLIQNFETAINSSDTIDQLLFNLSRIVTDQSDCLALWACQASPTPSSEELDSTYPASPFGSAHLLTKEIQPEGEVLWDLVEPQARKMMKRVAETKTICSARVPSKTQSIIIVAPISNEIGGDNIPLVVAGCFSIENQTALRQQWLIGFVAQSVACWFQSRTMQHQEHKTKSLNDTIGLVHTLDQTETIHQASLVIVNHLRRLCDVKQVALSFCDHESVGTLKAISDVEQVDLNSESNGIVANACNQAISIGTTLCYPSPSGENTPALLALQQYCDTNGLEACINIPLQVGEDRRTIGSVLVAATEEQISNENFQNYLGRMVQMASGHLEVVLRANRGVRDIVKSRFNKFRKARLTRTCVIAAACIGLIMCVPLPYRVGCDCEVQPVLRRFVAAPHDGILEKTFVESGDIVEANQIVAHLDGRQMRIELSVLRAEFAGAKKKRDSSLAQGDVALSQIARSEMRRHQSKIDILEQQLTNLEVRTPIAGIVVSGDLEKVQGAPLEMGQTLFEIAPLDEMLAEVAIPESEIHYVKQGMKVAIKLDSFPFKTWNGTVQKIHPRTEIVEDESVFIAQVVLPNDGELLRPGMRGSVKIKTAMSPIGWNLFHNSWESVRYWLIW